VPYLEPPVAAASVSQLTHNIDERLAYNHGTNSTGVIPGFSFQDNVYTPQNVAVAFGSYLNAQHGNISTVSLNENNHLVLSRTGTEDFKFYEKSSGIEPAYIGYPFVSLADVLGVSSRVVITSALNTSVTFPSPVNLAKILSYHININNDSQAETTNSSRSTFIVPIHVDSYELQKYNVNENPKQIVTFRNATKVLDIEWTTDTGDILTQHGTWSILLKKV